MIHMTSDACSGEEDQSEEEGEDEAPPKLPALQFNQESMQPGIEYLGMGQNLDSLMKKVSVVSTFTNHCVQMLDFGKARVFFIVWQTVVQSFLPED